VLFLARWGVSQMRESPTHKPHVVYRLYSEADDLLYVGLTADWPERRGHHRRHKEWWPEVARTEFDHCYTREAAANLEARLIHELRPRYADLCPAPAKLPPPSVSGTLVYRKGIARLVGKSDSWVRDHVELGGMPFVMVGGRRMFDVATVRLWLKEELHAKEAA
jgi:predicted GIY-YIG superfamily endonuclease